MNPPPDHLRLSRDKNFDFQCEEEEFTRQEHELLTNHGNWLSGLSKGEIQPYTDAQKRFIRVSCGHEIANTSLERAWLKLAKLRVEQANRDDQNLEAPPDHLRLLRDKIFDFRCEKEKFTRRERELLTNHGNWLSGLSKGEIQPYTNAQKKFVRVSCRQEIAKSELEKVWVKLANLRVEHATKVAKRQEKLDCKEAVVIYSNRSNEDRMRRSGRPKYTQKSARPRVDWESPRKKKRKKKRKK